MNDFDLQPHLTGELVELRPLRADDWDALFAIASDPLIWEQHPARERYKEEVFREFFRGALESGGAFTVMDRATGDIIGCTRYCAYVPERSEIEIGWTFLARSHWGGLFNVEMKRMMLDHAFQFVDSVVFVIGPDNNRSRKAVEKIGGVLLDRHDERGHVTYQIRKQTVEKASPDP
jgi:RimJ/RimL family protein N-acetyltransferase